MQVSRQHFLGEGVVQQGGRIYFGQLLTMRIHHFDFSSKLQMKK
jgi:hypothetical protein